MSYIKEQNKLLETLLKIKKFKNLVITGLNQDHKCANCHMSTMCYEYDTDKIHNNLNSFLNFFINNNIQANNLVIENNEFLANEISLNLFFELINSNLFPKITIKTDLNLINPDIIKILLEQDFGIDLEFHFYNNGLLDLNNPANALLLKNKYIIKFFGLVTPDNCTD